jgi:hypothetical protein
MASGTPFFVARLCVWPLFLMLLLFAFCSILDLKSLSLSLPPNKAICLR